MTSLRRSEGTPDLRQRFQPAAKRAKTEPASLAGAGRTPPCVSASVRSWEEEMAEGRRRSGRTLRYRGDVSAPAADTQRQALAPPHSRTRHGWSARAIRQNRPQTAERFPQSREPDGRGTGRGAAHPEPEREASGNAARRAAAAPQSQG